MAEQVDNPKRATGSETSPRTNERVTPIDVFVSYCHRDEPLCNELGKHLKPMEHEGLLRIWYDRRLTAGNDVDRVISEHLERACIILLLISPDFISSEYCWTKELQRALERHAAGEALTIPVILRPVDWHHTPFAKLLALPKDGTPVTSWNDLDIAFLDVAQAIRTAAGRLPQPSTKKTSVMEVVDLLRNQLAGISRADATRLQRIYADVVVPSYEQLKPVHENYSANLSELRDHLRNGTLAPRQLIRWVRARGLKYRADRDALWSIDAELRALATRPFQSPDSCEEFQAAFTRFTRSIIEYYRCTVSWHGTSFHRAAEDMLEATLESFDDPQTDLAKLFYAHHAVEELTKELSVVCDNRLPEHWRAVARNYREVRAYVDIIM